MTEFDPPKRLVHEWRSSYNPELAAEEPSRVTWEIEPQEGSDLCLLTVTHDQLDGEQVFHLLQARILAEVAQVGERHPLLELVQARLVHLPVGDEVRVEPL